MPTKLIVELDCLIIDIESNRRLAPGELASIINAIEPSAAGSWLNRRSILRMRCAGGKLHRYSRADARIRTSVVDQPLHGLSIFAEPRALIDRAFVPIDAQPMQIIHRLLIGFALHARAIEIF